jgi:hypothetical protein
LLILIIKLTAELKQVPKELDCQVNISQTLRVTAQRRVELESNAVPSFAITLIERMDCCEAVERIVLLVQLLVALASHNHVESKLSKVFHLQLFESHLFLKERHNN